MKKERVVGLCICIVLWGSLQSPRIFGCRQFAAAPSLPRTVWAIASGEFILDLAYSRIGTNRRSDPVSEFVCTGWPPLGILYSEMRLMNRDLPNTREEKEMAGKSNPQIETLKDWLNGIR
jgi:hypothetical protein